MKRYKVYFWRKVPIKLFREIKRENKERLRDYMNVYICENIKEMYEISDKLEGKKIERDYGARTMNYIKRWVDYESGEYVKTSPCCGYILFNQEEIDNNTIAHESSHAVIGYFGRQLNRYADHLIQKIDLETNEWVEIEEAELIEELYCYMCGGLVHQIVHILTKKE